MPLRHFVYIEQQLFRRVEAAFFTAVFVILLSLFAAGIIVIAVFKLGQ